MEEQNQQQPIEQAQQPKKTNKKIYKKWWFWTLLIAGLGIVGAIGFFIFIELSAENATQGASAIDLQPPDKTVTETASQEKTYKTIQYNRFGHSFTIDFETSLFNKWGGSDSGNFREGSRLVKRYTPLTLEIHFFQNEDMPIEEWAQAHVYTSHGNPESVKKIDEVTVIATHDDEDTPGIALVRQEGIRMYTIFIYGPTEEFEKNGNVIQHIFDSFTFVEPDYIALDEVDTWQPYTRDDFGFSAEIPGYWMENEQFRQAPSIVGRHYQGNGKWLNYEGEDVFLMPGNYSGGVLLEDESDEVLFLGPYITFRESDVTPDEFLEIYNNDDNTFSQVTSDPIASQIDGHDVRYFSANETLGLNEGIVVFEDRTKYPFVILFDEADPISRKIIDEIIIDDDAFIRGHAPTVDLPYGSFRYASQVGSTVTVFEHLIDSKEDVNIFSYEARNELTKTYPDHFSTYSNSSRSTFSSYSRSIAMSEDGERYAYITAEGIWLRQHDTGVQSALVTKVSDPPENSEGPPSWSINPGENNLSGIYSFYLPQWSPDGSYVSFVHGHYEGSSLGILDVASKQYYKPVGEEGWTGGGKNAIWSSDSSRIVFANGGGYERAGIHVITTSDLSSSVMYGDSKLFYDSAMFHPNENHILYRSLDYDRETNPDELTTIAAISLEDSTVTNFRSLNSLYKLFYSQSGGTIYYLDKVDTQTKLMEIRHNEPKDKMLFTLPEEFNRWEYQGWVNRDVVTFIGVSDAARATQVFLFDIRTGKTVFRSPILPWYTTFLGFVE